MKRFFTLTALCASASLAQAGGMYDATGTITSQSSAVFHPISEGHMAIELLSQQTAFDMAMDGHPFEGMSGNCTGTTEVMGASATGGGMCFYESEGGGTAINRWTVTGVGQDGAFHGRWVMVAGTGDLSGITGGGTYVSVTNRETGAQSITLTGAVSMP